MAYMRVFYKKNWQEGAWQAYTFVYLFWRLCSFALSSISLRDFLSWIISLNIFLVEFGCVLNASVSLESLLSFALTVGIVLRTARSFWSFLFKCRLPFCKIHIWDSFLCQLFRLISWFCLYFDIFDIFGRPTKKTLRSVDFYLCVEFFLLAMT